jgi:hypothetical protein
LDILSQVSNKIAALPAGEEWVVTAQDLWVSRNDFRAIFLHLIREAEQGEYTVLDPASLSEISMTIKKNA